MFKNTILMKILYNFFQQLSKIAHVAKLIFYINTIIN